MPTLKNTLSKINLKRFESGIWAASGIQAVWIAGSSIYFPFLPLYLNQERHLSMILVGLVILISGLVAASFQIIGGVLADKFGHRRMLIEFQIMGVIAYALLTLLINLEAPTWSIILLSIMVPAVTGMAFPAVSAIVADVSSSERLAESYSLLAIGANLGWAIGPLAGGYLVAFASYTWLFAAATAVYSLSLIGILFLPEGPIQVKSQQFTVRSLGSIFTNSILITFCVLCILVFLDMGQWGSTLSVFTVKRIGFTPEQYGLLMTISGVLIIIFQYPIARRIERLGTGKALVLGSFLYGAGFLSLSWIKGFIPAVGSISVLAAGEMLFIPTALAVVGKISRPEDRGKNLGFFGLCQTLGSFMGPLLGGFLLDTFSKNAFFIWGPIALTSFTAAAGFLNWHRYLTGAVTGSLAATETDEVVK